MLSKRRMRRRAVTEHLDKLCARASDPEEILDCLQSDLLAEAVRRINQQELPFYMVLYEDEPIPTNERNLTDVRTRRGVLLEYEGCVAMKHTLGESSGSVLGASRASSSPRATIALKPPLILFRMAFFGTS